MSGRSLRFEWSALTGVTAIIALLPAWLVTASVVWLPFGWWGQVNYWQFVGSLFLLFILLFSRPVQRFVLMRLLGARNPTSREQAILAESWLPIVQRNDLQRRQFVLAVVDTESLNAFACGGHLVVVSSQAIEQLDSKQLSGVLAHELSHHLGLHTVALTITQWMILPITVLSRVGMRLRGVAESATIAFAQRIPLLLNVSLATLLGNAASRATEFHADRRAAQLGFGSHLLAAMRNWDAGAQRADRGNVWQRIVESHPPMRLRINKLALYLRQYGRA